MQNDQLWEFKHPNFNRHGLEFSTIKRKITLNKRGSISRKKEILFNLITKTYFVLFCFLEFLLFKIVKEEGEKNFDDIQSQVTNLFIYLFILTSINSTPQIFFIA